MLLPATIGKQTPFCFVQKVYVCIFGTPIIEALCLFHGENAFLVQMLLVKKPVHHMSSSPSGHSFFLAEWQLHLPSSYLFR